MNLEAMRRKLTVRYKKVYLNVFDEAELQSDINLIYVEHIMNTEHPNPEALFVTIFKNKLIDKLRKIGGETRSGNTRYVKFVPEFEIDNHVADMSFEKQSTLAVLRKRAERLPPQYLKLYKLMYEDGLVLSETYHHMGVSESRCSQIHDRICNFLRTGNDTYITTSFAYNKVNHLKCMACGKPMKISNKRMQQLCQTLKRKHIGPTCSATCSRKLQGLTNVQRQSKLQEAQDLFRKASSK